MINRILIVLSLLFSSHWAAEAFSREVKPTNTPAYKAICNTLTAEDQAYVKLDKHGMIDRELINSHVSESINFKSLQALVNDRRIIEIIIGNEFIYKDKSGSIQTGSVGVTYSNELDDAGRYMKHYTKTQLQALGFRDESKPNGTLAITLLPGGELDARGDGRGSPNDNIIVIISSDLTERDVAKKVAHEGNGHALFYVLGKDPNHAEDKFNGGNKELEEQIDKSVEESERNYDASRKKSGGY